ncbi:hypothetical protein [Actinoplanes hulinensis]|uniref:hypothetical protein n=1 Tax=Actinoplanes hulinensis TaxID=1144547 RepID=UPI001C66D465|nr:hypothetical protein [Actinoplanes hulinensis]
MARIQQSLRRAAGAIVEGADPQEVARAEMRRLTGSEMGVDPSDFPAAQELGGSVDTVMEQRTVPLDEAGEVLNRSELQRLEGEQVHVICPMVIPKGRSLATMLPVLSLTPRGSTRSTPRSGRRPPRAG